MQLEEFAELEKCPSSFPKALQALWYEKKGNWQQAHEIVQNASDIDSAWVHGYLHRKEGDLSNAGYWYRRSGKPESTLSLVKEWEQIAIELLRKV